MNVSTFEFVKKLNNLIIEMNEGHRLIFEILKYGKCKIRFYQGLPFRIENYENTVIKHCVLLQQKNSRVILLDLSYEKYQVFDLLNKPFILCRKNAVAKTITPLDSLSTVIMKVHSKA